MCLKLDGFCAEEMCYPDSLRFWVQNISDHPSLIPVGEKRAIVQFSLMITDPNNWLYRRNISTSPICHKTFSNKFYVWLHMRPTWSLDTMLHKSLASASAAADFDVVSPLCIPGNEGRAIRWSSSRLPWELASSVKNFSGSGPGKVKRVTLQLCVEKWWLL